MSGDPFKMEVPDGEISSADLVRECGKRFDRELWNKFQERFRRLIFKSLLRAVNRTDPSVPELVNDLAQDVYLRLVRENGQRLRSFRGVTDPSVVAFFAQVCMSVVIDRQRRDDAKKRKGGNVISLEEARLSRLRVEEHKEDSDLRAFLAWIDVQRFLDEDPDQRQAARRLMIFKLHHLDGFSAKEIAAFPGFEMDERQIERALGYVMARLRKILGKP